MRKEGKKSSGLSLAFLFLATCCNGHSKDWPKIGPKYFINESAQAHENLIMPAP